jgi:RNA polymerase sigma factor (sigma-70 family)
MNHASGLDELLAEGRLSELCEPATCYLLPRIPRMLAIRSLPASLLDDALQETFLRALRYLATYDPELASARTWLLVLARSAVADLARRHLARRAVSLHGQSGELLYDIPSATPPADPRQASAITEEALAAMPPRQREAARMRLQGHSQKEAASRLGMTPGNVGLIFHHFRRRVQALAGAR